MAEVVRILDIHGKKYHQRIAGLAQLVGTLAPRIQYPKLMNKVLLDAGRDDLLMDEGFRVELPQLTEIPDPSDTSHIGEFGRRFDMTTDTKPVDIHVLRDLAATGVPSATEWPHDHRGTPAFYRGLIVARRLIAPIVTGISSGEHTLSHYGPEIFVAHFVMTQLVSADDPGALKPGGAVNQDYMRGSLMLNA